MAMDQCLQEGQFPPRWVGFLGLGYGYPLFNYYAPLAYYLAWPILKVTGNPVVAIHSVFVLGLSFGGWGVWKWLKRYVTTPRVAWLGVALYVYFPYHWVNACVRGDISELLASSFFFWVLWSIDILGDDLSDRKSIYSVGLLGSFFYAAILLSHNITSLIFSGFLIIYCIVHFYRSKKSWLLVTVMILGGLGLACFFWLPAFIEKKYVGVESLLRDAPFWEHYVYPQQLFIPSYGFGGSVSGLSDGMSFNVGLFHWVMAVAGLYLLIKRRWAGPLYRLGWIHGIGLCVLLIMMTPISYMVWKMTPLFPFVMYPWRLLSLVAIPLVFLSVMSFDKLLLGKPSQYINLVLLLSILVVVALIFPYWGRARHILYDPQVLSRQIVWNIERQTGTYGTTMSNEYLPKTVIQMPEQPSSYPVLYENLEWVSDLRIESQNGSYGQYQINSDIERKIIINRFMFPGWYVKVNGNSVPISSTRNGLIQVVIPAGQSIIEVSWGRTRTRMIAEWISIVSILGWLGLAWRSVKIKPELT